MPGPLHHDIYRATRAIASSFKPNQHEDSETRDKGKLAQRSEAKGKEKLEKAERRERNQAENVHPHELCTLKQVAGLPVGSNVNFRARIHTQRRVSQALNFLLFRIQTDSIQGVLSHATPHMIRWVQKLPPESLVHVTGTLQKAKQPVSSATFPDVEVHIYSIHLANSANNLPFNNYEPPETLRHRLSGRVVDLRHPTNQAIFRVRAMVVRKFREALEEQGFLEIQTPKLQPAATENGAEVFKVQYFGRAAFLAQSPQLAKQMAISADFERVYEIGPVFRAENSNTHRHLTEYTGLDIEMSFRQTLKTIFSAVQYMPELKVVRERWPSKDLLWLKNTLIIPFSEGLQMLREDGRDVEEEDLSTRDEMGLGELVRERFHTDYYILDKFPTNARPFYTHKAEDPKWTNSFDIFLRGQEICTGGQRIHDAEEFRKSMAESKISENGMEEYLAAFDVGPPSHGGAGFGLERIVMLLLELDDVRNASLFPRDPKSLPARPLSLPHPEADTMKPRSQDDKPPIEKLIANYGDATNTSWLDERFKIWRHPTGAAVGFVKQEGQFAMIAGNPLCDTKQYDEVIASFVDYLEKDLKLTPVWMLVSEKVQSILASKFDWRTMSCVEEQRVEGEHHNSANKHDARRVEREGIVVHQVEPDEDFMRRADEGIKEWQSTRQGKQKDNKVLCLVILAQLAPHVGWQVKWAFDFPSAPNSTIEVLVEKALSSVSGPFTFGAGVSESLTPGAHIGGVRAKFLSNTFDIIVKSLRLDRKAGFRGKFGVLGEQVYICYPRHGLSVRDFQQFVKLFEA
ncbi:aspartyl-tRNA synthetase [Whalleya microplaca]|nr:aspartyl-tRNA synthetase [Whalleya microplaca]